MKTLITVLLALSATTAFAAGVGPQAVSAPSGTTEVTVARAEVTHVGRLCPEGAHCFFNGSTVNVLVHLGGCLDTLGPVSYTVIRGQRGEQDRVYVTALRFANEASRRARCVAEPTETFQLTLPSVFVSEKDVVFVGAESANRN